MNYQAQVALTQQDDSVETLLLDGSHEPFRVGIQDRASRRQLDRLDTAALEDLAEGMSEERISVVNQVLPSSEKAIDRVRQIARHLLHPPRMVPKIGRHSRAPPQDRQATDSCFLWIPFDLGSQQMTAKRLRGSSVHSRLTTYSKQQHLQ